MPVDEKILAEMLMLSYSAANGTIYGFSETCLMRLEEEVSRVRPSDLEKLVDSFDNDYCYSCSDCRHISLLRRQINDRLEDFYEHTAYSDSGC